MKKYAALAGLLTALFIIPSSWAQEISSLTGQSMNGSTGLFSIPSGHIGWEKSGNFGMDFGYRIIMNQGGAAQIPAITMSLFKWVEVSAAMDFQPKIKIADDKDDGNNDLLFGIKLRMPTNISETNNPAIALGTNIQVINVNNQDYHYNVFQPYVAISYAGTFFSMRAETTVVFGKTFFNGYPKNNYDFDFGMGFDLILFPETFQSAVHWVTDFANFSYSDNSWPNALVYRSDAATYRGVVNTGIRVDLASFPSLSKIKLIVDLIFNDVFDGENRSFTVGAIFGFSVK